MTYSHRQVLTEFLPVYLPLKWLKINQKYVCSEFEVDNTSWQGVTRATHVHIKREFWLYPLHINPSTSLLRANQPLSLSMPTPGYRAHRKTTIKPEYVLGQKLTRPGKEVYYNYVYELYKNSIRCSHDKWMLSVWSISLFWREVVLGILLLVKAYGFSCESVWFFSTLSFVPSPTKTPSLPWKFQDALKQPQGTL